MADINLSVIPKEPGIYQMLDADGVILYVGKAKNLHKRVASYFNRTHADLKTTLLVANVHWVDTIVTPSEKDALILEQQLIKLHLPRFNILLKDDKNYPYIRLSVGEPFPRVDVVRQRYKDGARYFGPYPFMGSSASIRKLIHQLFPIRDCKQAIDLVSPQPKCLKLDLGSCIGPCIYKETKVEYDQLVQELVLFLEGKNTQLIRKLQEEMREFAGQNRFEKAAQIRDKIAKIESLSQKQSVQLKTNQTFHVWAFSSNELFHYGLVQQIIEGKLLYQNGFYHPVSEMDSESFMLQCWTDFYVQTPTGRFEILCDESATCLLPLAHTMNWPLSMPQRGDKKALLEMAKRNAYLSLLRVSREFYAKTPMDVDEILAQIQINLGLQNLPNKIIGVDISHLGGGDIVGSAVCFESGVPAKDFYRHFKIRSVRGQSHDPKSIAEVVTRRLQLCLEKNEALPDLLLIDGGKGQLRFASEACKRLQLPRHVDVISLAKQHEEIYLPNRSEPIRLSKENPILKLLCHVRDESHRFALRLQKKQRSSHLKFVWLFLLLFSVSAHASTAEMMEKLTGINNKIAKNQAKIREKKLKEKMAMKDLVVLNRNLTVTEHQLDRAKSELVHLEVALSSTKTEVDRAKSSYQLESQKMSNRIVQIYKHQNLGIIEFLFSSKDFVSFLESSIWFEKILATDTNLIKDIRSRYETLQEKEHRLGVQKHQVGVLKATIQGKQVQLIQQRTQKDQYVKVLRKEIEEFERQNAELLRSSREIALMIQRLASSGSIGGTGVFIRPTTGWTSSSFGYRNHPIFKRRIFHSGVDFAASFGQEIKSADNGIVIFSGRWGGYGNATIIDHGNNLTTVYAHQSRIVVQKGQKVAKGQLIGYVGSTGYSTGPHLHFEVRLKGEPVDPMQYLR